MARRLLVARQAENKPTHGFETSFKDTSNRHRALTTDSGGDNVPSERTFLRTSFVVWESLFLDTRTMSHRIVVCDDEAHITRAICLKLSKAGYQVDTFPNGQAAWESIAQETPSLVITDQQMPFLNGVDLCQRIRANTESAELPIIMLTAKGYELAEEPELQELGLEALIVKPFSPRGLLQIVETILTGSTCR